MKTRGLVALALILRVVAGGGLYRAHEANLERREAEARAARERVVAEARQRETERQIAAAAEARRLAELTAREENVAAERRLEEARGAECGRRGSPTAGRTMRTTRPGKGRR
jgi:hypothetical protein